MLETTGKGEKQQLRTSPGWLVYLKKANFVIELSLTNGENCLNLPPLLLLRCHAVVHTQYKRMTTGTVLSGRGKAGKEVHVRRNSTERSEEYYQEYCVGRNIRYLNQARATW